MCAGGEVHRGAGGGAGSDGGLEAAAGDSSGAGGCGAARGAGGGCEQALLADWAAEWIEADGVVLAKLLAAHRQ